MKLITSLKAVLRTILMNSVANKYVFQNVEGRFMPPNVNNTPAQPQQQQQSSSEEGSEENTILNGPRHQKEMGAQDHPSGPAESVTTRTSPYSTYTYITNWRTTTWAPPVNNQNVEGHQTHNHHQFHAPRPPGSTGMQWNHQWINWSIWKIW